MNGQRQACVRRWVIWVVRLAVTVLALGWTLSRTSWEEMLGASKRLTAVALLTAVVLTILNLCIGTTRWQVLISAYAPVRRPRWARLLALYWSGMFFSTFLPGNVGGDVLRAHATRKSFQQASHAYVVVLIERLLGLSGLLTVAASAMTLQGLAAEVSPWWLLIAAALILGGVATLPVLARHVAPIVPVRLRPLLQIPTSGWASAALAMGLVLSIATQALVAITGHTLIRTLAPGVQLLDSLAIVPVALVAAYFPLAVAGIGVREAAFVELFSRVGVARADAIAASLALLFTQLIVAAAGGLVYLVTASNVPNREDIS
jgi:glycosyltransferase 2 family protein